jgi:hypothetical protein
VQSFAATPPVVPPATPSSSIGSSTAGSSSSSTSSSSSSSSGGLGFRQPSSQLLLSCDEGAWGVVGLMLVAWLHWHCGVSQATAVESVSQALGVTLNEVSWVAYCSSIYLLIYLLNSSEARSWRLTVNLLGAQLRSGTDGFPQPNAAFQTLPVLQTVLAEVQLLLVVRAVQPVDAAAHEISLLFFIIYSAFVCVPAKPCRLCWRRFSGCWWCEQRSGSAG